ncbi:hypothetical protein LIER_10482 [Lithospermum erythrorhizon]|uniref:Uncharacterized protein n=1 Tax=Lithospermum erythrorhizon TaxID=34254 RepID=A0AAV3PJL2_LITER
MGARLRCITDEGGFRSYLYEKAVTLQRRLGGRGTGEYPIFSGALTADLLRISKRGRSFLLLISGAKQQE